MWEDGDSSGRRPYDLQVNAHTRDTPCSNRPWSAVGTEDKHQRPTAHTSLEIGGWGGHTEGTGGTLKHTAVYANHASAGTDNVNTRSSSKALSSSRQEIQE